MDRQETNQMSWSLIAFAIVILITWLLWPSRGKSVRKTRPPGPRAWPVIGNLHNLKSPPHRTLQDLAKTYGPVMFLRLGYVDTIVISSSEKAAEFFSVNGLSFANRPPSALATYSYGEACMAFAPYGPYWKEIRRHCALQILSPNRVEVFAHIRRNEVDNMVDNIWKGSKQGTMAIDIRQVLATLTMDIIWQILCGHKYNVNAEILQGVTFKKLLEWLSVGGGRFNIGDFIPWLDWMDLQGIHKSLKKFFTTFDAFAEKIIQDRLRTLQSSKDDAKPQDFIDSLLRLHLEGREEYGIESVKALFFDISSGAVETSVTAMEWTMSLMLKHPHVFKKVQKEIDQVLGSNGEKRIEDKHVQKLKFLQCVVKEAMRMYPPLPLAFRISREDNVVLGYEVHKESIVMLNLWAIGRDPAVWERPDEFMPDRFLKYETVDLYGHDLKAIPFGAGRRVCPGPAFALPTLLLTLATLVHTFDWKVDGEIDMTESLGVTMPRLQKLFAIPILR